jgi:Mn2+/Fe2+ NRAMP family transporter
MPIAVGMLGALVMPHNIYLHSAEVTGGHIQIDRRAPPLTVATDARAPPTRSEALWYNRLESAGSLGVTVGINLALMAVFVTGFHGGSTVEEVGLSTAGKCVPQCMRAMHRRRGGPRCMRTGRRRRALLNLRCGAGT